MILFDPRLLTLSDDHKYNYAGFPVVGVSEMLEAMGFKSKMPVPGTELYERFTRAGHIGTALAQAAELLHKGQLDRTSIHEEVAPFFASLEAFMATSSPTILYSEASWYSPKLEVCGTTDAIGDIGDHTDRVWDYKTSSRPARWHKIQACLYELIRRDAQGCPLEDALLRLPAVVYLSKKGAPPLIEWADWEDMKVARALPLVYHYRRQERLL